MEGELYAPESTVYVSILRHLEGEDELRNTVTIQPTAHCSCLQDQRMRYDVIMQLSILLAGITEIWLLDILPLSNTTQLLQQLASSLGLTSRMLM